MIKQKKIFFSKKKKEKRLIRDMKTYYTRFFFVKFFQKVPKNGFFDLFFQQIACGAENMAKTASF